MSFEELSIPPAFNTSAPVMGLVQSVSGADIGADGMWHAPRRDLVRYVVAVALPEGMARMDDQRSALPLPPMNAPIIVHSPNTIVLGVRMNDALYWHFIEQWDVDDCPPEGA